ncbi:hypothetical protein VKS41_008283 [Umbelopsis sp. WA50703]
MVKFSLFSSLTLLSAACHAVSLSTAGIESLVARRLPKYTDKFVFEITDNIPQNSSSSYDNYHVQPDNGRIKVMSSTLSGLNRGLYAYLTEVAQTDIYWTGSYLDVGGAPLPKESLSGASLVKWRYYFNTVTFSYTSAFWSWEEWELQLDWLALRGINLPLQWLGYEKVLVDTFRHVGLTDDQISTFLSGPGFQAWNRFGNIQGSWNGTLPFSWVNEQFELGKKVTNRMVELGMTPVMPAFTGFVPRAFVDIHNSSNLVNSSQWNGFPEQNTYDTLLEPQDPMFAEMQRYFIIQQKKDFGNISSVYTLDQFNELTPASGDTSYLKATANSTIESLKSVDPNAVWMMQGWLFFNLESFWTNDRIEAFLSGVSDNEDMLILDLYSEVAPQWQRTQSYFQKSWIWCYLHDYGGNMGLYGNIHNETVNPVEAKGASASMVGMGVTMEGQEGNEITYDLLLDQAWSKTPINSSPWVQAWAKRRYQGKAPAAALQAWEILRTSVYSNNDTNVPAVPRSLVVVEPATSGLFTSGPRQTQPTVISYDPKVLIKAWRLLVEAASKEPALMNIAPFHHDLTDVTRQVLANSITPAYNDLIAAWNATSSTSSTVQQAGEKLIQILATLDEVLYTDPDFILATHIKDALATANPKSSQAYFEYNVRNQITLWGPLGEINDYAAKEWAGLVGQYYQGRWQMFVDYLVKTTPNTYDSTKFETDIYNFEQKWNGQRWSGPWSTKGNLLQIINTNAILKDLA